MTEKFAHRLRAGVVGALTTLRTFAPNGLKSRMIVINLNHCAPYQEAAQGKWA
jgi:hypothetical protein